MKFIIQALLGLFACLIFTITVQASDPTKCGPGKMIAGDGAIAYSLNTTSWQTVILATTSGTLDCNGLFAANDNVRIKYISESYDQLKLEASKGDASIMADLVEAPDMKHYLYSDLTEHQQQQINKLWGI